MERYIGLDAPCVKLHAGGGERQRQADRHAGGGDERAVPDRGRATDPEATLHLPGGGAALAAFPIVGRSTHCSAPLGVCRERPHVGLATVLSAGSGATACSPAPARSISR
jgi:hypothetical protein